MKRYIIDRIEENIAVCECEDRKMVNLVLEKLPKACKEGDCIVEDDNGNIYVDINETKRREERAKKLLDRLME